MFHNQNTYKQCSKSVMDNIQDPDIFFDNNGVSNYYHEFENFKNQILTELESNPDKFKALVKKIKKTGLNKKYDCLIGVSGGLDSSYLVYLAKVNNLRPLLVHFDYGWNSEIAIRNIENLVKKYNFDLFTDVMDWSIIKELQRSYYEASVIDLDVPADHLIFGSLFKIAKDNNIKYILNGSNYQTEQILPKSWNYIKTDLTNIKNIYKTFTKKSLKSICTFGVYDQLYYRLMCFKNVSLLNYCNYIQKDTIHLLQNEFGWINYECKHFENIYTRFYQGVVLPSKFGIDKRKAHLSNLIFSGQITKSEALTILESPPYDVNLQRQDQKYVAKKLGFTDEHFELLLKAPNIDHKFYGTDLKHRKFIYYVSSFLLSTGIKKQLKQKLFK
jgi:N-acetyl sugar amidotransferase